MTTPLLDAPEWTDIPVELLKLLATSSMPHIAKERVELYVREREAAARADAEREVAALRAIVARYKVPLPLLRAAIENVRPYAGFHDDVRVITAADAFADILAALAKEEGS